MREGWNRNILNANGAKRKNEKRRRVSRPLTWPIKIQGSEVSKKGSDNLDSERVCNGQRPAERLVCYGASPGSTTGSSVSTVRHEGTWTSPQPKLPHIVVFSNVGHGCTNSRRQTSLTTEISLAAPNSLFLGIQYRQDFFLSTFRYLELRGGP